MDWGVLCQAPPGPPAEALADFDGLLDRIDRAPGVVDSYALPWPVWQFLTHAAATHRYLVHGTRPDPIDDFEPRQSNDIDEFGNRRGVYAASDALWAMHFAIVDRARVQSLVNTCSTLYDDNGAYLSGPWYFFSVSTSDPAPWRDGAVYLLPADGFEQQPDIPVEGGRARTAQLFHPGPVRPLARIPVGPADFPLLDRIRRHDHATVAARAAADPDGFPWLDET